MQKITNKVIDCLLKNNIEESNILRTLYNIIEDIKDNKYIMANINVDFYYNLQNIIWYNFERKTSGFGIFKLEDWGTKFPLIMFSNVIYHRELQNFIYEIDELQKRFEESEHIYFVSITANDDNIDISADKQIIIYNYNEQPIKYTNDYMDRTSTILSSSGEPLHTKKKEYILCKVEKQINAFEQKNMFINLLFSLKEDATRALESNKDLFIG